MNRLQELKERAQELRAVATFMRLPETRASILSMAELYERLAEDTRPLNPPLGGNEN